MKKWEATRNQRSKKFQKRNTIRKRETTLRNEAKNHGAVIGHPANEDKMSFLDMIVSLAVRPKMKEEKESQVNVQHVQKQPKIMTRRGE